MNKTCVVPANSRGGLVLIHDGYRYARRNTGKAKMYWQCTETSCGSYLHSNRFDVHDDDARIGGKEIGLFVLLDCIMHLYFYNYY